MNKVWKGLEVEINGTIIIPCYLTLQNALPRRCGQNCLKPEVNYRTYREKILLVFVLRVWGYTRPSGLFSNEPFEKIPEMTIEDFVLHSNDHFESHLLGNRLYNSQKKQIKMLPWTSLQHPGFCTKYRILNIEYRTLNIEHRVLYILQLQETARVSVCPRQVRGSILQNFCRLVAYLFRVVSLRQ